MWFHVFCKIDYHLYVKPKNNLLLMLIENVLPHCINPACKIFLLKRFVFSEMEKKNLRLAFSCSLCFHQRGLDLLVVWKIRRNELDQTKLNLLNPSFYLVVSLLFNMDGVNDNLKNQVYFEGAIGDLKKKKKRSSVSQYHVSPLHSTYCSWRHHSTL